MKTTDVESAKTGAGSRREFLRSAGRWGGAAALAGVLGWIERPRPGRGGVCLDAPLCGSCPEWPECVRPEALPKPTSYPAPPRTASAPSPSNSPAPPSVAAAIQP